LFIGVVLIHHSFFLSPTFFLTSTLRSLRALSVSSFLQCFYGLLTTTLCLHLSLTTTTTTIGYFKNNYNNYYYYSCLQCLHTPQLGDNCLHLDIKIIKYDNRQ